MNFPKLKNPGLCRILTYVVVIGTGLLPIFIIFNLPVHDFIKIAVVFTSLLGLLAYIARNFVILMSMDAALATLSCLKTARKQYTLPQRRTAEQIRRSIMRYGIDCEPVSRQPEPAALRYKFSSPITIYSRGIERVIAAYEVDLLDKDTYHSILRCAEVNSKALIGKRKAHFLDSEQKKAPLHRITVVPILAHRVDPQLTSRLYELVCRQCGNEEENCTLPCVVDLERRTCVFNCERVPYIGFSYAVKNRGIRMIKNRIMGGTLNLRGNTAYLPDTAVNPEDTLWSFWKELHHQYIGAERETKRTFEAMTEREIRIKDNELYLKWDQRGICQTTKVDTEHKIVQVEHVSNWFYPKMQPIGKKIIGRLTAQISDYYEKQGYCVQFVGIDMLMSEEES